MSTAPPLSLGSDPWIIPANSTWLSPQGQGTITGIDADVIVKFLDKGTLTLLAVGTLDVSVDLFRTTLQFRQFPTHAAFISAPSAAPE